MNARTKLLAAIVANPRQVRFADACKAAQMLGFQYKAEPVPTVRLPVRASPWA